MTGHVQIMLFESVRIACLLRDYIYVVSVAVSLNDQCCSINSTIINLHLKIPVLMETAFIPFIYYVKGTMSEWLIRYILEYKCSGWQFNMDDMTITRRLCQALA